MVYEGQAGGAWEAGLRLGLDGSLEREEREREPQTREGRLEEG